MLGVQLKSALCTLFYHNDVSTIIAHMSFKKT